MEPQTTVSKQLIDHRRIATHGLPPMIACVLGLFLGRITGTSADPDRELVLYESAAIDRVDDYWASSLPSDIWRIPHVIQVDHDHGETSRCGRADSTTGPFYCPASERVYLDLDFLKTIRGRLAQAYVIGHEIGHHVQKLRREYNQSSQIQIELGADCYAFMWIRDESAKGHLVDEDIPLALQEVAAVGDDRICPTCSSESWTHGSSSQRVQAAMDGLNGHCDQYRFMR